MSNDELLHRIQDLEDLAGIRQLKADYFAACDAKDSAGMRACFVDGPVQIDYGPIGCFDTADALVKIFVELGCHPHIVDMHHGSNPHLELLDAGRARGAWSLYFQQINTREHTLTQLGGRYADEYRKVGGAWKISSTVFTRTSVMVLNLAGESVRPVFAGRDMP
ncbi:MAG TPA: nuclear transport factor 2 family protein [Nevskiaceae bacterium]|nr:nuclear transport factor 2 family protein [Nevskiaceae bacterium]